MISVLLGLATGFLLLWGINKILPGSVWKIRERLANSKVPWWVQLTLFVGFMLVAMWITDTLSRESTLVLLLSLLLGWLGYIVSWLVINLKSKK